MPKLARNVDLLGRYSSFHLVYETIIFHYGISANPWNFSLLQFTSYAEFEGESKLKRLKSLSPN